MPPQVNSSTRREKSLATRLKIIQAATEEFLEKGFHGATVASIAERSGVAAQTVYFIFHTKPELMSAVIDAAVMGSDPPEIPQDSAWWAAMREASTAAGALREFVRGSAPLFARAASLSEILRAAALTDDEVRATHEFHERLRRDGFREVIHVLLEKGPLREGLSPDEALDVLLTVLGDSTYHIFTVERRWSHDRVVEWWSESLPVLLLADPGQ